MSVKWVADIDLESFIPRGYNLADLLERKAFIGRLCIVLYIVVYVVMHMCYHVLV